MRLSKLIKNIPGEKLILIAFVFVGLYGSFYGGTRVLDAIKSESSSSIVVPSNISKETVNQGKFIIGISVVTAALTGFLVGRWWEQ